MNKIDICAGLAQWEDIDNIIVMPSTEPCENNVDDIKVTSDSDFIYMLIECTENISFFVDSKWMNIFIGYGSDDYLYVINRKREVECMGVGQDHLGLAQIEKYNQAKPLITLPVDEEEHGHVHLHHDAMHGGVRNTSVGSAQYTVSGKYMQIQIPRNDIGLYGENTPDSFHFTVTDGVDSPDGFFSYIYRPEE